MVGIMSCPLCKKGKCTSLCEDGGKKAHKKEKKKNKKDKKHKKSGKS